MSFAGSRVLGEMMVVHVDIPSPSCNKLLVMVDCSAKELTSRQHAQICLGQTYRHWEAWKWIFHFIIELVRKDVGPFGIGAECSFVIWGIAEECTASGPDEKCGRATGHLFSRAEGRHTTISFAETYVQRTMTISTIQYSQFQCVILPHCYRAMRKLNDLLELLKVVFIKAAAHSVGVAFWKRAWKPHV